MQHRKFMTSFYFGLLKLEGVCCKGFSLQISGLKADFVVRQPVLTARQVAPIEFLVFVLVWLQFYVMLLRTIIFEELFHDCYSWNQISGVYLSC